jgi:Uma2 family endonuclease
MQTEAAFDYRGEYDENWPLPSHLTMEQYRHVIFRPDAHFVDGAIVERQLGDSTHGRMVGALIGGLYEACKEHGMCSCISLRLSVSATLVRVCDFVVLEAGAPYEEVPTFPPLLCIEVLSPGQVPVDELGTLADYLAMGARNIWLIDPVGHAAYTFDADGLHEANPTALSIPGTPIRLDLTEAFAAID